MDYFFIIRTHCVHLKSQQAIMLNVCAPQKCKKDVLHAWVWAPHTQKKKLSHSWQYNKNNLASSISGFGDEEFKVKPSEAHQNEKYVVLKLILNLEQPLVILKQSSCFIKICLL